MFCTNCGKEIADDATFCGYCGTKTIAHNQAPFTAEAAPEPQTAPACAADTPPKKGGAGKIALLAVLTAAALIILAAVFFFRGRNAAPAASNLHFIDTNLSIFSVDDRISVYPVHDTPVSVDGMYYYATASEDRTALALVSDDDDGALYLIRDGEAAFIDDDAHRCLISRDGSAVVYNRSEDDDYPIYSLHLWRDDALIKLTDRTFEYVSAISPSGTYILYTSWDEDQDVTGASGEALYYGMMLSDGGEETLLNDYHGSVAGLYVSDDASRIWYVVIPFDEDAAMLVFHDGEQETVLSDNLDPQTDFQFNHDGTQLICQDADGKWYLYEKDAERIPVTGTTVQLLTPSGLIGCGDVDDYNGTDYQHLETVLGITDFRNTLYIDRTKDNTLTLYRLDEDLSPVRIERYLQSILVAQDGRTVTYYKGGSVYRLDALDAEAKAVPIAKDTLISCEMSDDGQIFVYCNTDGELWYVEGDTEPVRISKNIVENGFAFTWSDVDRALYYIEDGELMISENGGKGEPVSFFEGDECLAVISNSLTLYVNIKTRRESILYISHDGETFTETAYAETD